MKHYIDENGTLRGLEEDGSQDFLITPQWLSITDAEAESIRNPPMTQEQAVRHFKAYTNQYIQSRIDKWNEDNKSTGIHFDDILSFPKYAVIPTDSRYAISVQFLTWNGAIWDTATAYMLSATVIPTEAEFKAVLDEVVF